MKARDLGYIAVSTALLVVSAWIAVPIGDVPVTLQTLVVCLIAGLFGVKRATFAVFTYILLGAVGVPVFAGFTGGVAKLVAPTGGYIFGLLPLAIAVGMGAKLKKKGAKGWWSYLACVALGLLVCYTLGTLWFMAVTAPNSGRISFWTAIALCVLPYLPFDVVKIMLAVFLTEKLKRILKTE